MEHILEYEYKPERDHLTEKEALDEWLKVRDSRGDAIVRLNELPCGYYSVETFKSEAEKQEFLRSTLREYMQRLRSHFRR